jgi:hypothetical protein
MRSGRERSDVGAHSGLNEKSKVVYAGQRTSLDN